MDRKEKRFKYLRNNNYLFSRKELEKRPISSGYIKSTDISTVPPPRMMTKAPFEDVLQFCSQYDEDGLYIDLVGYRFHIFRHILYKILNFKMVLTTSKLHLNDNCEKSCLRKKHDSNNTIEKLI